MKAAVVIACLALAGCRTVTTSMIDAPGEDRVAAADVIDCSLTPQTIARQDRPTLNGAQSRIAYETGPVWRRVFVGNGGSAAVLDVVAAHLTEARTGYGLRFTYDVDARLTVRGKAYPIHATGARAAGLHFDSARRQAVELAVVDTARQARAILGQQSTQVANASH